MAETTTTKQIDPTQFHVHAGINRSTISTEDGDTTISTQDIAQAALDAAVASYTYDAQEVADREAAAQQPKVDWETRLQNEADFIAGQLASWPADATNNTQALQLVNFLSAAVKRMGRNQERVLRFIRDNAFDSGA